MEAPREHGHERGLYARLWDGHCHTEFGYCATTVSIAKGLAGMNRGGLGGTVFVEHAWQVYTLKREEAWLWDWWNDPVRMRERWEEGRVRMDWYKDATGAVRGPRALRGIEVDVCSDGSLSLAPEDRAGWDQVIGAVHRLADGDDAPDDADARRLFMEAVEALCGHGVDVLAHPMRWFVWKKRPIPAELFDPVIELCRRHNVAAEINTHGGNVNVPEFFRRCFRRGVKIALGTDAHAVEEIAGMDGHIAALREAGIPEEAWDEALHHPHPNPAQAL